MESTLDYLERVAEEQRVSHAAAGISELDLLVAAEGTEEDEVRLQEATVSRG